MGTSTDALLLYGIPLEEGAFDEYDEELAAAREGPAWLAWSGNTEAGCCIITHCSNECPMYFVALPGSISKANRGFPRRITKPLSALDALKLKAFCKKYKLKAAGPAGWYLASFWG